jgi:hypothetical protein
VMALLYEISASPEYPPVTKAMLGFMLCNKFLRK